MLASRNGHDDVPRRRGPRRALSRVLLGAVALGGGLLAANCGGGSGDDDDNNGASPCDTVYRGQCGAVCANDAVCPNGLFCGGGTCTAQCTAQSGCTGGQTCSSRGRCVGGTAGSGTAGSGTAGGFNVGGSGPGTGGQGGMCPNITVAFEKIIPTIVLLIDQSGSMSEPLDPEDNQSPNRWNALKTALLGDAGVLKTLQGEVRFGTTLYTSDSTQPTPAGSCLDLTIATPALNNFQAIFDQYDPAVPVNNTPTGESVVAVTDALKAFNEPGPKFIVLATDGNPDHCINPDANGAQPPKTESVNAVTAAFNAGIGTFVIGVSKNSVDRTHLTQLALAGQGKPIDGNEELFFEVGNQTELGNAFKTIVNGARPCSFDIEGTIAAEAAPKGTVTIDNQPVPLDPTNGWQLTDTDTITFVGTACTQIQNGASNVQATFPCGTGGVTPIPR